MPAEPSGSNSPSEHSGHGAFHGFWGNVSSMRVFVTGGTGLLGNTVIRALREVGDQVVALVRSPPDPEVFAGLDLETVQATLDGEADGGNQSNDSGDEPNGREVDPIDEIVASCDAVIHAAGMIHLGWRRMDESMRVNRDGTRRIAEACLRHGKKLVHIGTVNAIAVGSKKATADETTPLEHAGGQIPCAYVVSKRAAVEAVRGLIDRGLNAVIVHPGFMLGPWDWKPSSGRMMLELGIGWKPISPRGGCSLCDSRDVAAGVVAALKSECVPGREFVMAGHNWTYHRLWSEMAKRMGKRPPLRSTGPGAEYLAGLAGDAWTRLVGKEGDLNSAGAAMSGQYHWYSSDRAREELGYCTRDAVQTLDDAAEWICQRFVLPSAHDRS